MRQLRACLLDEPLPRLIAMADLWDASLEVSSAREVAEALAAHMLQPDVAAQVRQELPQEAAAALDALLKSKGKIPTAAFERRFGAIRPMGPGKLERERPWLDPANATEVLWYRGFVFRAFDRAGRDPSEMVFVPADLLELLGVGKETEDGGRRTVDVSPSSVAASESHRLPSSASSILLDDITTILIHVQNGNVKVRANEEWTHESRLSLARMLRDADGVEDNRASGRFALLSHLIERLGWLRMQDGRARLIPQPVTHWLQAPPGQQRRVLLDAWLNDAEWNDLAHVPGLSLEMTHTWANEPRRERQAVVEFVQREMAEGLTDLQLEARVTAAVSEIKTQMPDFARVDGRYDTWHVRDVATGEFLNGFANWDWVEGRLIRYLLSGPLTWLEAAQADAAIQTASPIAAPIPAFTMAADGLIAVPPAHRFQRFQLARVADMPAADATANALKSNAPFVYRLTPRSLTRAHEQGIQAPRVIEFLEQQMGQPLPAHMTRAIHRWAERGPEVKLERVRLVRTKDGQTMDALLANINFRRVVLERLAPNCIAVRERDAKVVAAEVAQSGLLLD